MFCGVLFFIFIKMIISFWHYATYSPMQEETFPVHRKEKRNGREVKCCRLISQQNWFGEYLPVAVPESSPSVAMVEEKLPDIVLRGVASGARPGVVLEEKGRQQFYLQGEKLSSCNAVVERILPEQVMLRYQDNVIYLTLTDEESTPEPEKNDEKPEIFSPPETSTVADTFSRLPSAVQQALAIDPQKFFEYIRFTPIYKDGIAGHAVKPGGDRSLFDISGLKAGDITVALNGQDFTRPGSINIFMRQIYSMKVVRLTVLRNGERHNISVALR
ncbi:type II secretion system protein GspC [Escherichia coli]|uniref:type II secretion system protein GspC n=1 Tax=Escherichia coli TaxID=562 RepID=UPI00352532AF